MSTSPLPSVSVVFPAYNEADYIAACLESLQHQDLAPLEVIVVNNNSTDNTARIARGFSGVKVITETKQGIVYARNTGFDAAKGDIIARCDADSILPTNWIKHIAQSFAVDQDLAAISGPCTIYDLPKQLRHLKPGLKASHTLVYFKGSKAMLGHEVLFGSNMALRRSIWQKVRTEVCLDESKMHEDTDLSVHINAAGGKISFDSKLQAGIAARIRPDTIQAKATLSDVMSYLSRWTNTKSLHPPIRKSTDEVE